jgi:MFS family permease
MILQYALMGLALLCLLLPKLNVTILIALALMSILAFSGRAVIVAMIFTWFTDKQRPMAQAYIGMAAWLAAIVGYLFSGFSLQHFGLINTLLAGAAISIISIIILHFTIDNSLRSKILEN